MAASGGPPGFGGSTAGGGSIPYSGFGLVGTATRCFAQLARVYLRAGEVPDVVENDSLNMQRDVKEIASLLAAAVEATGKMFKEEHMRMIKMMTSIHPGGVGGGHRIPKGIMEHRVIQNLRAVSGDMD